MNVTLCSAFRNASSYIARYRLQMLGLAAALSKRRDKLRVIWCEGDSIDDTWHQLRHMYYSEDAECYSIDMFQHHHFGPDHGSVVNAERFANMAKVWTEIWRRIPDDADAVIFVESDLIWQPSTILALLDDLERVPAVAPMVLLERAGYPAKQFYDVWAFRRNGEHFTHNPPYVPLTVKGHTEMMDGSLEQIDSAGSCIVMRGDVARGVTWPPEDVVVGVCRQIRERGDSVWLDAKETVVHP